MNVIVPEHGVPIKAWTDGVQLEDAAKQQLLNVASMPFIFKHVAAMPDVHWGMGATVGSVIPTVGAIIPAAVGVDIGCGMMAVRLNVTASQLPDNLHDIRTAIEKGVPHGRTNNGGVGDRGAWYNIPEWNVKKWATLKDGYDKITTKYPKLDRGSHVSHLGTLGTGNHFIELCLDNDGGVWIMLHSGSRGVGNRIGSFFIEQAKKDMERFFINLPDKDLAYLVEGSDTFNDYVHAVTWAQEFAYENRRSILFETIQAIDSTGLLPKLEVSGKVISCHHNYIDRENHFGTNVWITRKGAVRARQGDVGIIPGSMGAKSYIVSGKGVPESFMSCSHGAGRAMSRGQAKKTFSLEDHAKAVAGVECRLDADVIDETPGAYKNIDAVMEAQKDLVDIQFTLKQVLCVKG